MLSGTTIVRSAVLLALLSFAACDHAPAPVGVGGMVTLDAQPIPEGRIEFEPLPGSSAQRRDAEIRDGNFVLPNAEGLLAGQEFRVIIKAFRKTGRQLPAAAGMPASDEYVQYLPDKYHSASELRVKVTEDEQQNQFVFKLVSE